MTELADNCDFSPMKRLIKEDLVRMAANLNELLDGLEDDRCCILGDFEKIKKAFIAIESRAATFYLNCYLTPFTDRYMDLSLCIQHLSERRHGALIAVERTDSLAPLLQPGVSVGAPSCSGLPG